MKVSKVILILAMVLLPIQLRLSNVGLSSQAAHAEGGEGGQGGSEGSGQSEGTGAGTGGGGDGGGNGGAGFYVDIYAGGAYAGSNGFATMDAARGFANMMESFGFAIDIGRN